MIRLGRSAHDALVVHFLALPAEDRRLRFGSALSERGLRDYVDRLDFFRDGVFGVRDDRLVLIGVAHLAFDHDLAELGLSVLPAHHGHGIGTALFARAAAHARNRFVRTLYMHCLSENTATMHIARKFGMKVVTSLGDADAHLELAPASPASVTGELVADALALYDHALKVRAVARDRIRTALPYAPLASRLDRPHS